MALRSHCSPTFSLFPFSFSTSPSLLSREVAFNAPVLNHRSFGLRKSKASSRERRRFFRVSASLPPLDLTEENVRQVLIDARTEFAQIFDATVGITGEVDLADLDGPFIKLRLKGRFWHKRSTVLARLAHYLKTRIPEILEVDIEDEKQLDDSPENF